MLALNQDYLPNYNLTKFNTHPASNLNYDISHSHIITTMNTKAQVRTNPALRKQQPCPLESRFQTYCTMIQQIGISLKRHYPCSNRQKWTSSYPSNSQLSKTRQHLNFMQNNKKARNLELISQIIKTLKNCERIDRKMENLINLLVQVSVKWDKWRKANMARSGIRDLFGFNEQGQERDVDMSHGFNFVIREENQQDEEDSSKGKDSRQRETLNKHIYCQFQQSEEEDQVKLEDFRVEFDEQKIHQFENWTSDSPQAKKKASNQSEEIEI